MFSACASNSGSPSESGLTPDTGSKHYRFADVPVPSRFTLNRDKSFVYETGDSSIKVGRLVYSGSSKAEDVVLFYQSEMINNGWKLVRSMEHSGLTVLLFEKSGWICNIIVNPSFASVSVEVEMGPRSGATAHR